MKISICPDVAEKLEERKITEKELSQCFENIEGGFLEDTRAFHPTDPITLWYVATTNRGRPLKVMFITLGDCVVIRCANDATEEIQSIYREFGC